MMHSGQLSDAFPVRTGVRHGCLLSPFLFLRAIDWTMKQSTSQKKKWNTSHLDDLDFADNLALLCHTQQQMGEKTNIAAEHSARLGLIIQRGKNEIRKLNSTSTALVIGRGSDRRGRPFHVSGQRCRHTGRTEPKQTLKP